jgi:hypothetical protein
VFTLLASIVASTELCSRLSRSTMMVPLDFAKTPGTFVKKCRTLKPTDECAESMV